MSGPRWEIKRDERGEVVDVVCTTDRELPHWYGGRGIYADSDLLALVAQAQRETEEAIVAFISTGRIGFCERAIVQAIERGEHWKED